MNNRIKEEAARMSDIYDVSLTVSEIMVQTGYNIRLDEDIALVNQRIQGLEKP